MCCGRGRGRSRSRKGRSRLIRKTQQEQPPVSIIDIENIVELDTLDIELPKDSEKNNGLCGPRL